MFVMDLHMDIQERTDRASDPDADPDAQQIRPDSTGNPLPEKPTAKQKQLLDVSGSQAAFDVDLKQGISFHHHLPLNPLSFRPGVVGFN